jgi:hypothetical protein
MVTRKPKTEQPPSKAERMFWRDAFLAAELPTVFRQGMKITPAGLAHLAAEYADSAVTEFRRRFK